MTAPDRRSLAGTVEVDEPPLASGWGESQRLFTLTPFLAARLFEHVLSSRPLHCAYEGVRIGAAEMYRQYGKRRDNGLGEPHENAEECRQELQINFQRPWRRQPDLANQPVKCGRPQRPEP